MKQGGSGQSQLKDAIFLKHMKRREEESRNRKRKGGGWGITKSCRYKSDLTIIAEMSETKTHWRKMWIGRSGARQHHDATRSHYLNITHYRYEKALQKTSATNVMWFLLKAAQRIVFICKRDQLYQLFYPHTHSTSILLLGKIQSLQKFHPLIHVVMNLIKR